MSVTASTFRLLGNRSVVLCPEKIILDLLNSYFFLLNLKSCFLVGSETSIFQFCNSSRVSPQVIISSWLYAALSMLSNIWDILFSLSEFHMAYGKIDSDH